jgi:hypothetical protein
MGEIGSFEISVYGLAGASVFVFLYFGDLFKGNRPV